MSSIDGISEVLSLREVRYVVVRPHRGMKDGIEVINAWNEDRLREFGPDERLEAIAWAQDKVAWSSNFDQVLAVFPPNKEDDDE